MYTVQYFVPLDWLRLTSFPDRHGEERDQLVASFPGSPLAPTKIEMEGESLVSIRTWYRSTHVTSII